jgi:hypothetical protein
MKESEYKRQMVNYENACVYKICCKDPLIIDIYVGSTCDMKKRKYTHKWSCNTETNKAYNYYVYSFIRANGGFENWSIILIEQYKASDKKDLEKRERFHIESLGAGLNKATPTRTMKEWREDNKDKILEQMKDYREDNKEHIKEQKKEWYQLNKEVVCEKKKIYRDENKERQKEYMKQYRDDNKGQIKEQVSKQVTCECGLTMRKDSITRHNKSKKHQQYLQNLTTN